MAALMIMAYVAGLISNLFHGVPMLMASDADVSASKLKQWLVMTAYYNDSLSQPMAYVT